MLSSGWGVGMPVNRRYHRVEVAAGHRPNTKINAAGRARLAMPSQYRCAPLGTEFFTVRSCAVYLGPLLSVSLAATPTTHGGDWILEGI